MIIILASRAFLRPLSPIIFSANALSDRRIGHIEKTEEKTTQVGEVSDAASCPLYGREELDQTENDHHILSGDREEEVDVNETIWEEPTKGQEYSIDRSRSSNHRDELMRGEDDRTDASPNSAEEKVSQEFPRPPITF